jgi:drug/metabolite transporter (DMT)-like permease
MGLAAIALLAIYLIGFNGEAISGHTWATSTEIALAAWLPGRLCWTLAVQHIGARVAALLASLQPMLVALLGVAVLGESLAILQWVGILTICTSVAWVQAVSRDAVDEEI